MLTPIRFANYLSPLLQETYAFIVQATVQALARPATLSLGETPDEFRAGQIDAGFLCGLLYVRTTAWHDAPVEVLAAPILYGSSHSGNDDEKPLYYSNVIARRDRPYTNFAELAGCTWAYNEPGSHSGYNLVYYTLLTRGLPLPYFGRTLRSGSHLESLRMVLNGRADAAAIDSQVYETLIQRDPEIAARLHSIDILGPSSSPPVAVARHLDPDLKRDIQTVLLTLHQDEYGAEMLRKGGIKRFVSVTDKDYDDIRAMWCQVQQHTFTTKEQG